MIKNKMVSRYITLVALGLLSNTINAATIYTDRDVFNNNSGPVIVDGYDSETYGWNPDDPYGSVRLSEEELNALSPEVTYRTEYDINYVGFSYTYQRDPGVFCSGCNLDFSIELTNTSIGTSSGVYATGFDIIFNSASDFYPDDIRHALVTFGDGSTVDYALPKHGIDLPSIFWGITSEELISSIAFYDPDTNVGRTSLIIDNLTIAPSPVPVPGALWLLMSGLIGLACARNYKLAR